MQTLSKAVTLFIISIVVYAIWVFASTPNVSELNGCIKTHEYEVTLCPKNGKYAKLSDISSLLKNLIIIAEDSSFYSHKGFEISEIKDSFLKNISSHRFARGGSTITQQLAKNVFLPFDKTLTRKIKEAVLAREIERAYSKDKILELYLNVIEFGKNIYGVKSAAEIYFNKPPSSLNLLEAAFITYLIPNPKVYSKIFYNGQLTPYSRYRILDLCYRMYRFHRITEDQYLAAKEFVDAFPWRTLSAADNARLSGILTGDTLPAITDDVLEDLPLNDASLSPAEPSAEELSTTEDAANPIEEAAPAEPNSESDSPFNE
jgi:monofunctional glycosyltransferase